MSFIDGFLKAVTRLFESQPRRPFRRRPLRRVSTVGPRLCLEALEERTVPSVVIGGLDGTRQGGASLTGGDVSVPGVYDASQDVMSTLRGAIRTAFPDASLSAAPALTADYLAGVNVVVTGSVALGGDYVDGVGWPATTLSADEQAALLHFVENGGGAVILVDNYDFRGYISSTDAANQSFVSPFDLHDTGHLRAVSGFPSNSGLVPAAPTDTTHPVIAGPFGTVSAILTADPGYFDGLGPYATGLATFSSYGTIAAAAIPRGALSPTSGPVVFVSDFNAFDNSRITYPGYDNLTFALNALAYVSPANQAPTANAGGPYTTSYGSGLTLDGSGSTDPDNDPLTYTWTVNGQTLPASNSATRTLTWTDLQALGVTSAGSYTVHLTVDDGRGGANTSADVSLTVAKATPVVQVSGGRFIYDGQGHVATGSVTGVNGEDLGSPIFTYSYTDNDGNSVTSSTAPVEPGYYTVTGSFSGNGNYESASATAEITIVFEAHTLTDLSKAFHAGRTIPIKIQLLDANGNNVSSSSIALTALRLEQVNADGTTQVALQDAGNANPDDLFRYDASLDGYIFNLSTKGLSAGTYDFYWTADGDPTEHELSFELV